MGFSLKSMIEEMEAILASDMKAAKKVKAIAELLAKEKAYADECGQLR